MISACMIVRDGEATLERALSSLKGYVDEIIIAVDSRTTDRTRDIIERHTPRIWCPTNPSIHPPDIKTFDYDWNEDFSQARNLVASKASHDWILVVDADDEMEAGKQQIFRDAVTKGDGVRVTVKTGSTSSVQSIRCYNRKTAKYVYAVHEYLKFIEDNPEPVVVDVPIIITHHGHACIDQGRNLRILKTQLEAYPRYLFYYARETAEVGDYEESILAYTRYLDLSTWAPEKCEALIGIARGHIMMEDLKSAKDFCFRAIIINPDWMPAWNLLGQIASVEGDFHTAVRYYETALDVQPTKYVFDDTPGVRFNSWGNLILAYHKVGETLKSKYAAKQAEKLISGSEWIKEQVRLCEGK